MILLWIPIPTRRFHNSLFQRGERPSLHSGWTYSKRVALTAVLHFRFFLRLCGKFGDFIKKCTIGLNFQGKQPHYKNHSWVGNCETGFYEIPKLQCFNAEIRDFENHPGLQSLPGVVTLHCFSGQEARAETVASLI